jgi:hypothetical protein
MDRVVRAATAPATVLSHRASLAPVRTARIDNPARDSVPERPAPAAGA